MGTTDILAEISINGDIARARKLAVVGAFLYLIWYIIHTLVYSDINDSLLERLALSAVMLSSVGLSYILKLAPENTLRLIQSNRWILITHYFTLVARNDIALQYSVSAFFLVFMISMLFTTRKYFAVFSAYVFFLSLLCGEGQKEFPGYLFQTGMATCLIISYMALASKFKLIESLKASEELFRSMFQNSLTGKLTINSRGQIEMVNRTFLEMIGRDQWEVVDEDLGRWAIAADRIVIAEHVGLIFVSRTKLEPVQCRFERPDGKMVWIKISGSTIKSAGNAKFALFVCENITQQVEAENVIKSQQQSMIHASKMTALGEMSGGLAHEINTPLAVITMTAYNVKQLRLKNKLTDKTLDNSISEIIETVDRISKIIIGLRKFSRDTSRADTEIVTLFDVVNDGLALCRETFLSAKIELRVDPMPDYLYVKCRPVELSQVLINLLNNSKDSIRAQEKKWIQLGIQQDHEYTYLSVTDSGAPIPQVIQNKLFQPFYTTKPVGEGTGLGLSISLGIIRSFGGILEYDASAPNCRFVIKLPRISAEKNKAS